MHDRNEVLYFKVLSEHPPDHEGDLLAEFRQIAHRCPARRKHGGCQCHVKAPPASRYAGRESRCPPCLVSGHFQPGASGVDGVLGARSQRLIVASTTFSPSKGDVIVTRSSLSVTPFQ
jgi:hypothetical protein